LLQLIYIDKTE